MTTLKHLAMAVMAFLLTTAGFLVFLREVLPPAQVLAAASAAGAMAADPAPSLDPSSQVGSPTASNVAGILGLPPGIDVGKMRDLLDGVDPDTIQSALRHLEAVKAGAAAQGDNGQAVRSASPAR